MKLWNIQQRDVNYYLSIKRVVLLSERCENSDRNLDRIQKPCSDNWIKSVGICKVYNL